MPRRTPRRRPGRRTLLNDQRTRALVDHIENCQHISTACDLVGIGRSTVYHWVRKGEDAQAAIDAGRSVDETQSSYAAFADTFARARARAEQRAMDTVRRAMEGGSTIFEEPVLDRHGMVQCHPGTGEPLMRRRFSPPDGRLALEYLARMDPARYGRQAAPWGGHTAAGPESVEQSEVVAGLAKRLAEVRAKQQEDRDRVRADGAVDGGAMPSGAATGGSQPHWASSTPTLVPGTPSSG